MTRPSQQLLLDTEGEGEAQKKYLEVAWLVIKCEDQLVYFNCVNLFGIWKGNNKKKYFEGGTWVR